MNLKSTAGTTQQPAAKVLWPEAQVPCITEAEASVVLSSIDVASGLAGTAPIRALGTQPPRARRMGHRFSPPQREPRSGGDSALLLRFSLRNLWTQRGPHFTEGRKEHGEPSVL